MHECFIPERSKAGVRIRIRVSIRVSIRISIRVRIRISIRVSVRVSVSSHGDGMRMCECKQLGLGYDCGWGDGRETVC